MASETAQRWVAGAVATPFAWFLGTGGHPLLAALSLVATLSFVQITDIDERVGRVKHQHTHSLLFAVVLGLVGALVGWVLADQFVIYAGVGASASMPITASELGLVGFMIGWQAVVGHLLADIVTSADVYPIWPIASVGGSCNGLHYIDPRKNEDRYVIGTIALTVTLTTVLLTVI